MDPVQPFWVTRYWIIMVPEPVAVNIFPLIVPGPDRTEKVPPAGVAVKVRVSPLHIGALLLVMEGLGV